MWAKDYNKAKNAISVTNGVLWELRGKRVNELDCYWDWKKLRPLTF